MIFYLAGVTVKSYVRKFELMLANIEQSLSYAVKNYTVIKFNLFVFSKDGNQ